MAQQSVRRAADTLEPTKAYIEACMRSPKRAHVFILVEGFFDKHIYEERFNPDKIHVMIAAYDNLHHNRSSVQNLVKEINTTYSFCHVVGIRDKDYSVILGQQPVPNIYTTDDRDLEMMIFRSPSFNASDHNMTSYLNEVLPYCVDFGHIRIYAESKGIRNREINDKMNISSVYDQQKKSYVVAPKSTLRQIFRDKIDATTTDELLDNFTIEKGLSTLSPYDVCRGHDVVTLMGFVHGNDYVVSAMEEKMEQHYGKDDFYSTDLFLAIESYCMPFNISAKC